MILSAVIPCYNEEASLPIFYDEFVRVINEMRERYPNLRVELVLVDDGSKDDTLSCIKRLAKYSDANEIDVKYISFSRNFGKESALYAGLSSATGDYVVTMDADMQDPPALLPTMFKALVDEEYDNVATRRSNRAGEPAIRSFFARMFYCIMNKVSSADIVDGARDFRLMRRSMVDAICEMGEYNRFSKGIFSWVGFSTKWISYDNVERSAGETKWSFRSLFRYALDGITAFSTAPLSFASVTGIVFCAIALISGLLVIIRAALFGDPVAGWPSTVALILLIGGLQLLSLGIMGHYLAKVYLETKRRPLFIVKESNLERDL